MCVSRTLLHLLDDSVGGYHEPDLCCHKTISTLLGLGLGRTNNYCTVTAQSKFFKTAVPKQPGHNIAYCSHSSLTTSWCEFYYGASVLHFLKLSPLRGNWYFKVCHLHRCQNSLGVLLDVYRSILDYSPGSFGWKDGMPCTSTNT